MARFWPALRCLVWSLLCLSHTDSESGCACPITLTLCFFPLPAALLTLVNTRTCRNFEFMPELHWSYGYGYSYVLFIGVALLAVGLMWRMGLIRVSFFRRACCNWWEGCR